MRSDDYMVLIGVCSRLLGVRQPQAHLADLRSHLPTTNIQCNNYEQLYHDTTKALSKKSSHSFALYRSRAYLRPAQTPQFTVHRRLHTNTMSGHSNQGPGLRYPSNKKSIYDRNLNRSKTSELSRAAFAYLFIEMIAYAQKGAKDVGDLEQR